MRIFAPGMNKQLSGNLAAGGDSVPDRVRHLRRVLPHPHRAEKHPAHHREYVLVPAAHHRRSGGSGRGDGCLHLAEGPGGVPRHSRRGDSQPQPGERELIGFLGHLQTSVFDMI